ncbi:MAG TPA: cobalamin biosynthesis protein [Chloroflexota bacterium]
MALTRAGVAASARLPQALAPVDRYVPARLAIAEDNALPYEPPARELLARLFPAYDGLILFMALGAAVRLLAPLLRDKQSDPAVVVVDETATFAISVLSGHIGGANALTREVAAALGATPVITTASDGRGLPALDLLGRTAGWRLEAIGQSVKRASAAMLNGETLLIYQDAGDTDWQRDIPAGQCRLCTDLAELAAASDAVGAAVFITDRVLGDLPNRLSCPYVLYRPPTLVVGIGCSRGAPADEIEALLLAALVEAGVSAHALHAFATIDLKRDEPGIGELARRYHLPVSYFSASQLATVRVPNPSPVVEAAVGTPGVCEPAALLAAGATELLLPKRKSAHATVALARRAEVTA